MEKRISKTDERNMTTAIEKAASAAVLDATKDRNQILADELLSAGVDSRFAKRASHAFNKRLTVLTFDSTPDDKRGDSFPLADPDKVFELTGGVEPGQTKTASAKSSKFSVEMSEPQMEKAAAEKKPVAKSRKRFEERTSADGFVTFIGGMMQKHAAAFSHECYVLDRERRRVEAKRQRLVDELKKTATFKLDNLYGLFGDDFEKVFGKDVGRPLTKHASVVRPDDRLTNEVESVIKDTRRCDILNDCLCDYRDGLCEFTKIASDFAQDMRKLAFMPSLPTAVGVGARTIGVGTMTALQAADAIRRATNDAAAAGFSNASALASAGTNNGVSPSKVLDAEFLVKDRFRDRLMSWSDMAADPLFSMFPAEQVFNATQKAMDVDPSLERPDRRELLRTHVGKLLAQNNREGEADLAALGTTIKSFAGADQGAAEAASQPVLAMDKVTGPEKPELINIMDLLNKQPLSIASKDYAAAAAQENQKALDADKSDKDKTKDQKEDFAKFLQTVNVRIKVMPNHDIKYIAGADKNGNGGTEISLEDLNAAFDAFQKSQVKA